ncbi:protein of unknown function [Paraburkholderia kururiensis]
MNKSTNYMPWGMVSNSYCFEAFAALRKIW